jgi:hypothetical protein
MVIAACACVWEEKENEAGGWGGGGGLTQRGLFIVTGSSMGVDAITVDTTSRTASRYATTSCSDGH